jgi:POT family proton-dependent oligopeptide transporter
MSYTTEPEPRVPQGEPNPAMGGITTADAVGHPNGAAAPVPTNHPPALYFFFWGEFAERASYYGMRGILPMYLAALGFSAIHAQWIYNSFKMSCYFLPLLGGYLADRFFGRYWTIVGFCIPYILGHFILGIESPVTLFIALALLAGGSGVIKPNISTLMGQTYDAKRPGQERLRSAAFMWFYLSINIGAVLSQFSMPEIRDRWGYATAFQFPAWLMVGSFLAFAAGKPFYAPDPREYHEPTPEERAQRWRTLWSLFGIFGLIIFFWVPYEYNDSFWVYFARDYVNRSVPWSDKPVPPDQIQFLNPLFVVILVPLFTWLFKRIDPQLRIFRPTRKILMGFVLTAVAAGIMSAAGFLATGSDEKVSILWIASAYIILTVGEVLLYATALELAYAAAPKSMKGFVTACFLVTNTLANFINMFLAPLYGGSLTDKVEDRGPLGPGQFFGMTALIALAATIAFVFVGRQFDRAYTNRSAQAA